MDQELIIIFIVTFLTIVVSLLLILKWRDRDVVTSRFKNLEDYRRRLADTPADARGNAGKVGRLYVSDSEYVNPWMRLVNKILFKSKAERERVQHMFQKAGWRSENSMLVYALTKFFVLIPSTTIAWIYIHYYLEADTMIEIAIVVGAALLSSKSVDMFVNHSIKRRQIALTKGFPDALDLMVICAESGLSLSAIIQRVAKDVTQLHSELGYELEILAIEINLLGSRKEALQNFAKKLEAQICKNIIASMIQSEEYGTPISQTMKTLSEEFRYDRLMQAEQSAARLPVLMAGPLVLFIFPSLFIVLLGPVVIKALEAMR